MKHSGASSRLSGSEKDADASFWEIAVDRVASSFRFTESEREAFRVNKVARLIAELPLAAGCPEAERTSLAHLATYVMAARGGRDFFGHTPSDDRDPLARLRLGMSFSGGDEAAIRHGMSLLALVMLCGYERDRDRDRRAGEYNPLNSGRWEFESMRSALLAGLAENPCPALEGLLPPREAMVTTW